MFALASVMRFAVFRCDVVRCGVCCGVARLTMREYPSFFRAAQSAVSIWLRVLSLNAPHHAYYKTFIKNNNSPLTREEVTMLNISSFCKGFFSIKKRVRCYYSDTIDGIEDNQDALEMELRRVRYLYNVLNGFASGFVFAFLSGFAVLMVGCAKTTVTQYDASSLNDISTFIIYFFFVIILFCQWFFLRLAYTYYEKMKIVEKELKKINNTVQPKPKKPSIRICNRNLVRRSVFGR